MDYLVGCWCDLTKDVMLKAKCIGKGRCSFDSPRIDTHGHLVKPREVMLGVLTDYFNGMSYRDLRAKWKVSGGYVYKKLRLAGIPGRGRKIEPPAKANTVQSPKRKLIPYAGKE